MNFKCDDRDNTFHTLNIEHEATVMSVPKPCPNCNSYHTYPSRQRFFDLYPFGNDREVYKRIWEKMDKEESKCNNQQTEM